MKRPHLLFLTVALSLSGCAATPTAEPSAAPSPSSTLTQQPVEDDMAACAAVTETLIPVADIVTDLVADGSGALLDPVEISDQADKLRAMLELSTARMDAYAAPYASAVLLLDDIYEGRADGGEQTMNTGAYRDGAIGILSYCVDTVGYKAPQ